MKSDPMEETIEGFRIHRSTSKKLHDFLEVEGISKKKWLESKIEEQLLHKMMFPAKNFVIINKKHYRKIFGGVNLKDTIDDFKLTLPSSVGENISWDNFLKIISVFCKMNSLDLWIVNEGSNIVTVNLKHDICRHWSDFIELLLLDIAHSTKEAKLESCIKTNMSIMMKFEKL